MSDSTQAQKMSPAAAAEPGEPCGRCGAALAPDQRYCLNCGKRRGEPRVDFRRHMKAEAGSTPDRPVPAAVAPTPPPGGEKRQRDYAPLAAAGGIAVLGVMLLIGVLIGRGTGSVESSAPPQVVTVGEAAAGAGAEQKGGDKGAAAGGATGSKKNTANSSGGEKEVDTGSAPVVSDDALQGLEEQSGESYSDASSKLPDEIATGGAPPPEDSKAPGGGSGAQTIE